MRMVVFGLVVMGCAQPAPPHVCASDDARLVFAYETYDVFALDLAGLPLTYLFVTADCRYFVRPAAGVTPVRTGRLDAEQLAHLNRDVLTLPWRDLVNAPRTDDEDAVPPTAARGSLVHHCNDGCPDLVDALASVSAELVEGSAPLTTPLWILTQRDDAVPSTIDLALSVPTETLVVDAIRLDGADAAAVRAARDAWLATSPTRVDAIRVRIDGDTYMMIVDETLPIQDASGALPPPLDPAY